MKTRDRVRQFVATNPDATYREIQIGCGLSAVSQVSHHLRKLQYEGRPSASIVEENARLRRQVEKLKKRLAAIAEIADETQDQ